MKNIKIVEYDPKYAKAIADMWNCSSEGWEGSIFNKTEEIVKKSEASSSHLNLYLALDGKKVIGYCKISRYFAEEDTLYIDLLSVDPAYHGKKVGKMLVKKSVERTIELGYPRLDLFTWAGNTKAVPLYKKCGFFWEKMENDATHLMNFIPTIFNTELFKDYFKSVNWYDDSTRMIDIAPDGRKEKEFDYLVYSWSKDGKDLMVEFEKSGRGIRKIECDDYVITATVEKPKLVFGQNYKIKYEIVNKTDKPLAVEINGMQDKNISLECNINEKIKGKKIFEAEFFVDKIEIDQSDWQTHPGVMSEISINGKKAIFKTGIKPQFPLKMKSAEAYTLVHSGIGKEIFVNVENNFSEDCTFEITLHDTEDIRFVNKLNKVKLKAKEKNSFPLKVILSNSVIYYQDADITAIFKKGKKYSFKQKFSLPLNTHDGRSAGENDRYFYMSFGKFSFSLDKFLDYNQMIYRSINSNIWSYIGAPKIGKPNTSEFQRKAPYKNEIVRSDSATLLKLYYRSKDFPGCEFTQNYELSRNGMLKQWFEIVSFPNDRDEFSIKFNMNFDRESMTMLYDGKLMKINKIPHNNSDLDCWDSTKVNENWLFSEKKKSTMTMIWAEEHTPNISSWDFSFDHKFTKEGSLVTKPLIFAIDVFDSVKKVREYVLNKEVETEKIIDGFDLEINTGNPFVGKKPDCAFVDYRNKPIHAEVKFNSPDNSFSEMKYKATPEDKLHQISSEISFKGNKNIELVSTTADYHSREFTKTKAVFVKKKGNVKFKEEKINENTVFTASNNVIEIKSSPEFAPSVFSLKYNGNEWLDSDFPVKESKSWFNPWFGGITNKPNSISHLDWIGEKTETIKAEIKDNFGNIWKGFEITTYIEKFEPMKGMICRQYFLLMPNIPVMVTFHKIIQKTGSFINTTYNTQSFIKAGDKTNQATFSFEKDGKDVISKCGIEDMDENSGAQLIVSKLSTRKDILHQYICNKASFWATSNPTVIYTDVYEEKKIKNGETKVFPPKFFMFNEEQLTEASLTDLQNIKFEN